MRPVRFLIVAVLATAATAVFATASSAQTSPTRAATYINPDTGAATENPEVEPGSSCHTPDQNDTQPLGDALTGANNVHVDACLFDDAGTRLDTQAAFEVIGPVEISACPDPDGDGPKTATQSGSTCVLSGFEADNEEYHVRVVGTGEGVAQVDLCADPEGNGCADATVADRVVITFRAGGGSVATPTDAAATATPDAAPDAGTTAAPATPVGAVAAGEVPVSQRTPLLPVAAAGVVALAGSLLWSRRQRA